ncbi:hypothetical protein QCA50_016736 [Cerrena zonata]|uniref:Uncharacterized protein n=1 Tax=Cerrena zonata TaxID=2478898 RepID=A0AAW0FJ21_9APHY
MPGRFQGSLTALIVFQASIVMGPDFLISATANFTRVFIQQPLVPSLQFFLHRIPHPPNPPSTNIGPDRPTLSLSASLLLSAAPPTSLLTCLPPHLPSPTSKSSLWTTTPSGAVK